MTDISANIIDHIITNDLSHKQIRRIIRTDKLSDHYMTYVIIKNNKTSNDKESSQEIQVTFRQQL